MRTARPPAARQLTAAPAAALTSPEDQRLLSRKLLVGQHSLVAQLPQLRQARDVVRGGAASSRWCGGGGSRCHGRLLSLVVGLVLLLGVDVRAMLAGHVGATADGGGAEQGTASQERHRCTYRSSSNGSPSAAMISAAAAIVLGPPTWGATAL